MFVSLFSFFIFFLWREVEEDSGEPVEIGIFFAELGDIGFFFVLLLPYMEGDGSAFSKLVKRGKRGARLHLESVMARQIVGQRKDCGVKFFATKDFIFVGLFSSFGL